MKANGVLLAGLMIIITGCVPGPGDKDKDKKAAVPVERVISQEEAVSELPCFKCHEYKDYTAGAGKGGFSHAVHAKTGYHCNQCHDLKAHKLSADIPGVCGKCHKLQGMTFQRSSLPSSFDHESHAKRQRCRECHPKIFAMKAGSSVITMDEMDKGKNCGQCHNGKKAFGTKECAKCHDLKGGFSKDVKYAGGGAGAVVFGHTFHTAAFACDQCHPKLFAMKKSGKLKMEPMYEGKSCGACHNGQMAFASTECAKCHDLKAGFGKDVKYDGGGAGAVVFGHQFHTAAFGCAECHPKLFASRKSGALKMDPMYEGKSCGACHNGQVASAVTDCAKCHKQ